MRKGRKASAMLLLLLAGCGREPSPSSASPLSPLGTNARGYAEYLRAKDGMPMVLVPAGSYPRRPYEPRATTAVPDLVDIPAYLIDKLEVSNAQFARFLKETGTGLEGSHPFLRERPWGLRRCSTGWEPQPGYEAHPAVGVTGWGALAYAKWAGAELPTPDAWMKAAGGPDGLEYPFGSWKDDACNWRGNGIRMTAPVTAFPESASPVGCLNMAGNVTERVFTQRDGQRLPVMIKGGSWVTAHPLNLRVLDLCMQGMDAAEQSVGFRCILREPAALAPPSPKPCPPLPVAPPLRRAPEPPRLVLAEDFYGGVEEARERNCVLFLSLHLDTCGQCDRTREELLTAPALVAHLNAACVTVAGQDPGDAGRHPHPPRPDGTCPLHPGLTCAAHEAIFKESLGAVRHFEVSPGMFLLTPKVPAEPEPKDWILVGERDLPKNGEGAELMIQKLEEAQAKLGPCLTRDQYLAIKAAMEAKDRAGLAHLLEGKDTRIPLVREALAQP